MPAVLQKPILFYPELSDYIESVLPGMEVLSAGRREHLSEIAGFVRQQIEAGQPAKLTFICTHNSRRSHFGQIWAATAATYFELEKVETYSGGTEATAFNPRAVAAIRRAGFRVENPGGDNPRYFVRMGEAVPPLVCFSKTYDDPFNPREDFAAIMTCSEADMNCPFVPGAALRVPVAYDDPKEADNTPEEVSRYDERCRQIATEMFYLFSLV